MKVYVGADHRGYELKDQVIGWLKNRGIEHYDLGADELIPEDDFNDYAVMVAKDVLANPDSFGVLLCGSAQGVCMQANRFKGIRAAFCHNAAEARETREHNDANVLCIAADENQDQYVYEQILDTFLSTAFLGYDRYVRRNKKLDEANDSWLN